VTPAQRVMIRAIAKGEMRTAPQHGTRLRTWRSLEGTHISLVDGAPVLLPAGMRAHEQIREEIAATSRLGNGLAGALRGGR